MRSGRSVLSDIERRVRDAEEQRNLAAERVSSVRRRLESLRSEETQALAELARVRLGELEGKRVSGDLDAADRQALTALLEREREGERLAEAIADGAWSLDGMVAERRERIDARDAAADEHATRVAEVRARLDETEAWIAQHGHATFAGQKAANAHEKCRRAELDRDEKRRPYEADKLFAYLWRRRYRFPEYRAIALIRTLDAWVAKLCGYEHAHRDYAMLLEIPVRLRAHADGLAAEAEAERQKLAAIEAEAMAAGGVPELLAALERAQAEVAEVDERIRQAEAQQDALLVQQSAIAAGSDPWTNRATHAIETALVGKDVQTLQREALATVSTADDRLADRVATLRQRSQDLRVELAVAEAEHARRREASRNVEDLARRFRRQDFESAHSVFDADFDVGTLVASVLSGVLQSGAAFAALRRRQRWNRPSPSIFSSSGSSGPSNSGSLFGGGSFGGGSSHGGFGGGGFSTGGGFGGGGGGFKTGGSF